MQEQYTLLIAEPSLQPRLIYDTQLIIEPGPRLLDRMADLSTPGIRPSLHLRQRGCRCMLSRAAFYVGARDRTQVFILAQQTLYHCSPYPTSSLILMPRSDEPSAIVLGGVKHPLLKWGSPLVLSPNCASCLCSLLVGKSRDPCPQVDFPSPILLPQFTPISSLSDYRAEWDPSYENYLWNKLQPYFSLLIFLPQRCMLHHLKDPFV